MNLGGRVFFKYGPEATNNLYPEKYIQGGPTLTIFAITRFLIIQKNLRLARKRRTLWS
jgi:hypothetical protein